MTTWLAGFCCLLSQGQPPADAVVTAPAAGVKVYVWRRPRGSGEHELYVQVTIADWPTGVWGAEVELTPIPNCCGAVGASATWRRSDAADPRRLAVIGNGQQYRLDFHFRR